MSDRSNDSISFLAGGIIGAAIGTVIGLMFAPTSGEHTRKKLKKHAENLAKDVNKTLVSIEKEQIQPRVKDAKEYVKDTVENVNKKINETKKEVKSSIKTIDKEKIRPHLDKAKDYIEDTANEVKKAIEGATDK